MFVLCSRTSRERSFFFDLWLDCRDVCGFISCICIHTLYIRTAQTTHRSQYESSESLRREPKRQKIIVARAQSSFSRRARGLSRSDRIRYPAHAATSHAKYSCSAAVRRDTRRAAPAPRPGLADTPRHAPHRPRHARPHHPRMHTRDTTTHTRETAHTRMRRGR